MVALEYKIDLSRLNVIELDNSKKINEVISIVRIERDNSRYHQRKRLVVTLYLFLKKGGEERLEIVYIVHSYKVYNCCIL